MRFTLTAAILFLVVACAGENLSSEAILSYNEFIRNIFDCHKYGMIEEAVKQIDLAIAQYGEDAVLLDLKGSCLPILHRYDEAVECLRKSYELDPQPRLLVALAMALMETTRRSEALDVINDCLALEPDNNDAIKLKLGILVGLGYWEEAIDYADSLLHDDVLLDQIPRSHEMCMFSKLYALMELERYEEFIELISPFLSDDDAAASMFGIWGMYNIKTGDYVEAYAAYLKAKELDSTVVIYWGSVAYALLCMGRIAEAEEEFSIALEVYPDEPCLYYARACGYARLGDKQNALADLAHAIEIKAVNRMDALQDEDFESLWDDPDFIELTSEPKE